MRIRRAQMLEMLASRPLLLRNAIKQLVRTEHAYVVEGLPDNLFDEMIENGIRTASRFQITEPQDAAAFVLVMFEVGPEFHRHARVRDVLADPGVAPREKLTALFDRTPAEVWEEIEAALPRQTWFPELREPDAE